MSRFSMNISCHHTVFGITKVTIKPKLNIVPPLKQQRLLNLCKKNPNPQPKKTKPEML